ncbi:MAG: [protein-PII] uridylyltransferase, partial [Microvirga sp.]|nr:[protein-PII] uridylyltransferase [Microvirga sp.]
MPAHSLETILQSLGGRTIRDATELRASLVPLLKAFLDEGKAEAEAKLLESQEGLVCARYLCDRMDQLVRIAHDAVVQHLYPSANPSSGERLAVVATGGYGRGTLAPGSDVDLLFLLPYKQTAWSESVVEAMLYVLWDLKLKVGHATRSVEECLREAQGDMTIRTSLLEMRLLFGDRELFDDLARRFDKEIIATSAPAFVDAKLKERDARVAKAGASRYLVEPNVKDGKGGLRDLNTLFWIAKYVYRVKEPEELVTAGLFTKDEFNLFARCEEFLWRVRCHMHFATGRAEERLTFDLQRSIAERIGVAPRGGLSAVERFMKAYFLIAKDVGDLTAIVCAELEARQTKPRPMLDRVFGRFRRRRGGALLGDGFVIDNNRLNVENEGAFERDPVNLIRLFWLADRRNLAIHPDAKRLATRSLKLIGPRLRNDPEANKLFLEIIASKNAPEVVLRQMNEAGVLGRLVPDFGRIVAMMQFNMYHHYTVDEHLVRSVGVLTEIEAGQLSNEHPLANHIFPTIRNRRALYVAVFLHDIAKGRPEDHSTAGAAIARKLGPRFGLSDAETDTVAWLIEHHLLMSNTAQSRDLSDPATIKSFADVVQTMERLKLLLVLTVADIRAVGPGTWTGWKGQLLRNLYHETEVLLGGGAADLARSERVRLAQEQLRAELPDWPDEEFEAYVARHTPGYWMKTDETRRAKQARLLRESEKGGRTVTTAYETDQFRDVTELTILSPDHPRLLAIITGACAASGGN